MIEEKLRKVLMGPLSSAEKLVASAILLEVPLTAIGISGKSITRHEKDARAFVDQLPGDAPGAPRPRERERADAGTVDRWLQAQERDLRDSLRTKKPMEGARFDPMDPYR